MFDHVSKIVRREPIVERHQDGPELRHCIELLEHRVRVRGNDGHAITLAHAVLLQRSGPAVTTFEELRIRQTQLAVDDGLALAVQLARAPGKLPRTERKLHCITLGLGSRTDLEPVCDRGPRAFWRRT